ncbi:16S rRNA (cytosine(1402)-N(4))-methyltransferase RsmH [Telmatospirillum sp.]|uniref:16S rRNA (cytosine(1402)-N(4))-methyltransferase RsmH n=1 Tax=Telmatospirillum sp. TaxID=2079197 RepID=UPI0028462AEF|nr:16S rRNA (cytosine(1402)-N(4))-methyltransferase RsmH [Telmatospirillum sp.]MDR3435783.1 16S rRNA (cytosine(1402)-N(4))-methyltransferase RsmH [Telmatospirillum sp.]
MSAVPHISVLLKEVVEGLAPKSGAVYVDGTFGAGGYSRALLDAADCRVIGIDRDPSAVARGEELSRQYGGRLTMLAGRFGDMDRLLADQGLRDVDGVALDLGVSSMQIDEAERGFSFQKDGPLDMRMEKAGLSAADMVNTLPEIELADIIWRFGEERHSRRVARAIVTDRKLQPFETTRQLAELVRRVVPRSKDGIDPATRTFQGLRIAVNDELGEIDRGLAAAERLLRSEGRLAVVSFHSLEDRAVKEFLKRRSGADIRPSRHLPVAAVAPAASFRLLTRKPVQPGADELAANPRARSSRLRLAERLPAPAWPASEGRA